MFLYRLISQILCIYVSTNRRLLRNNPFIYHVSRFWDFFWPTQTHSLCKHDLYADVTSKNCHLNPPIQSSAYVIVSELEIVGEWVMNRQPFWIKIFHISPILLDRFSDKKEWKLLSMLCSLWGIYGKKNLQCVFSVQTLQCAMFWFSLKLA